MIEGKIEIIEHSNTKDCVIRAQTQISDGQEADNLEEEKRFLFRRKFLGKCYFDSEISVMISRSIDT